MKRDRLPTTPVANPSAVVGGTGNLRYRFTYSLDSIFEDRASTMAINRNFPESLEIITNRFHLRANGLRVQVKGNWWYGEPSQLEGWDLGGTARTLDGADGRIPLGPGVIARNGYMSLDDSQSMLFTEDGWVSGRRQSETIDGYLFTYGLDYKNAIKAFYALAGSQPLLPRWALGNWWSRYYKYTGEEYLALMDRFDAEGIPMSVGVLDMDWHWVDNEIVKKSGLSGWTGYSWNTDLFPDPEAFVVEMHKRDLKVTLNDHPADGVASYEDLYEEVCEALGKDALVQDPVPFDITNKEFLNAYFNILLRTLEDQGVDFWWVDWQQGSVSAIPGIDPLWMLNHFHFLSNSREGKRPIAFSRFAGPGSHRYPIGFSGDTVVTWESLDFQPEFTATASNIGYGWWSHDIGGHMQGYKDDELATRWVQLGVFSPILRLHSSNNHFNAKEPWHFTIEAHKCMVDALRFRHRLIPYLYSMNVRSAWHDEPLVQPLYWGYPEQQEAYRNKNIYFFGSEMIVAPLTSPRDAVTRRAGMRAWLPPGKHVDIFSGIVYDGNREIWIYRTLDTYAVFAQEGSIIPLDALKLPGNGGTNPESLEIIVVVGRDGSFDLYEDDGNGRDIEDVDFVYTPITYTQKIGTLSIGPVVAKSKSVDKRNWTLSFLKLDSVKGIRVMVDNADWEAKISVTSNSTEVVVEGVAASSKLEIVLGDDPQLAVNDVSEHIFRLLGDACMLFDVKKEIWSVVTSPIPLSSRLTQLHSLNLNERLLGALQELLLADSRCIS
ncbi:glycosyl hydrolases family 31-domain-containing protein [Lipomyces starkeyi]